MLPLATLCDYHRFNSIACYGPTAFAEMWIKPFNTNELKASRKIKTLSYSKKRIQDVPTLVYN